MTNDLGKYNSSKRRISESTPSAGSDRGDFAGQGSPPEARYGIFRGHNPPPLQFRNRTTQERLRIRELQQRSLSRSDPQARVIHRATGDPAAPSVVRGRAPIEREPISRHSVPNRRPQPLTNGERRHPLLWGRRTKLQRTTPATPGDSGSSPSPDTNELVPGTRVPLY